MASSLTFITLISILVSLFLPSHSLTCTSQKLNSTQVYANCTDLPYLDSYLHYSYNSTNSSLSIAFVSKPPSSDGYVAWGINPNGTGMVGTQALVAVKSGSVVVPKTYNLVSYRDISESKLSFEVWDLKAESDSDGKFNIYGSVKVPSETVNQVWQVGPAKNGVIGKHEFAPANLGAKSTLALVANSSTLVPGSALTNSTTNSTTTSTTNSTTNSTASGDSSDGYRLNGRYEGLFVGVSILVGGLFGM